jgi:hypothetical protein
VIDNSGSLEKLGRRVDEVWQELQRLLAAGVPRRRGPSWQPPGRSDGS